MKRRGQDRFGLLRRREHRRFAGHRLGDHCTISDSLSREMSIGTENVIVAAMETLLVLVSRQLVVKSRMGLRISGQGSGQGGREHGRTLDERF